MAGGELTADVKAVVKVLTWDEAEREIASDVARQLQTRLWQVHGGLTRAGRDRLQAGLIVAAAMIGGATDGLLTRLISDVASDRVDIGRLAAEVRRDMERAAPVATVDLTVDDRLLTRLADGGDERAVQLRRSVALGHDMVPKHQAGDPYPDSVEVLVCSRCQYGLEVCSRLRCDPPGVMRPLVDRMHRDDAEVLDPRD